MSDAPWTMFDSMVEGLTRVGWRVKVTPGDMFHPGLTQRHAWRSAIAEQKGVRFGFTCNPEGMLQETHSVTDPSVL